MSKDPARQIAESARTFTDPAERSAYLDRVCRGIARLRADVERHLAEMDAGGGGAAEPEPEPPAEEPVVARPVAPPVTASESDTTDSARDSAAVDVGNEKAGDRIGRFLLVKELGEGGFGTVWKAEQVEPVKRTVALKIIKLGMDTEQVVARFEQERQALALMDHPHVARVIDAGATRTGRPYFVMDLVQGVPIGEFCDAERLTVEARLEVFAQVCAAVQHAHMKGIIHRDLKPSNVLVTMRDGKPHATVIDFGIAKATSSKLTDRSLVTEAYQVIGTLQYMSPEQSQASPDIDTRTDVYSLGIILYELLTGTTPYDTDTFQRAVLSDILRMIGEADAPPPSAKITETGDALPTLADSRSIDVKRLASSIKGELDWIVLKSIEKDRARRYESAEAFAADIRRYLAGEEVSAAPPSATYRLRKFVRRNKGPVAAAAAVAAALVAGIVGFAWQAGVAERERDDAVKARKAEEVERKRAEDVATLIESLFDGINPDGESAGDLRAQLVERLADLSRQLDAGSSDPVVNARIRLALGRTQMGLGEFEGAEAQFRAARAALQPLVAPGDERLDTAMLGLAATLEQRGKFAEAIALVGEMRGVAAAGAAHDLDHTEGMIRQAEGRLDLAVPLFEAAAARVKARGGEPTRDDLLVLHTLATSYRMTGRAAEAVDRLREVLDGRTKLLGADHAETLMTANSLAVALSAARRDAEAIDVYRGTIDRLLRRRSPEHPTVLAAKANLAGSLSKSGRHEEAIAGIDETCRIADAVLPDDSVDRARHHMTRVSVLVAAGKMDVAVEEFERTRASAAKRLGPAHADVAKLVVRMASAVASQGDAARGAAWLEESASAAEGALGPDCPAALELRQALGRLHRGTGNPARAVEILTDVVARQRRVRGGDDPDTLDALHDLGCAQFSLRQSDAAAKTFEEALAGRRAKLGADHADTLATQGCLGSAHWQAGRLDMSVPLIESTLLAQERTLGPDHASTLSTAMDLAVNLNQARELDRLYAHLRTWMPRLLRDGGPDGPGLREMGAGFLSECVKRGALQDGTPTLEALYEASVRKNGPDHEESLTFGANLAASLWSAGALDRSVPLFREVYDRRVRLRGADDPRTLGVAGNLAVNLRDAGRADEAVMLFEDTLRRDAAASGGNQGFLRREYAKALHLAGRTDDAVEAMRVFVADARKRTRPQSTQLAAELVQAGMGLVDFGRGTDAEPVLAECVAIREQADPAAWGTHSARSILGAALVLQGRFAEAEPLVIGSVEALTRPGAVVPPVAAKRVEEARHRVLDLYAKWDAAEPGKGHDVKLAEWKAKLGK